MVGVAAFEESNACIDHLLRHRAERGPAEEVRVVEQHGEEGAEVEVVVREPGLAAGLALGLGHADGGQAPVGVGDRPKHAEDPEAARAEQRERLPLTHCGIVREVMLSADAARPDRPNSAPGPDHACAGTGARVCATHPQGDCGGE